ncbi:MAG TPA: RidA family protein [Candidatus Limnocylindria bacterium]|nr:RidA family protein [Candidatus Limnocylindria bacterium]
MAKTFGPYSPVRKAGSFYYVSGQVGVDPETNLCGHTVDEQTAQALTNIEALLSKHGLAMGDVVKVTIYVTDMSDFAAVNEVYTGHFEQPYPARATVGVKDLPHVGGEASIKVEIEAIAYKAEKHR